MIPVNKRKASSSLNLESFEKVFQGHIVLTKEADRTAEFTS